MYIGIRSFKIYCVSETVFYNNGQYFTKLGKHFCIEHYTSSKNSVFRNYVIKTYSEFSQRFLKGKNTDVSVLFVCSLEFTK